MNHDEKNSELHPWIEPDLEARIVAAVLGEASAFELAELERLAAEKPEIAVFRRRIAAVHGLLGVAAKPDAQPLRLSAEKRQKVFATIGASPAAATRETKYASVFSELAEARRRRRKRWAWTYGLPSALAAAAMLTLVLLPNHDRFGSRAKLAESVPVQMPVAALAAPEPSEGEVEADLPNSTLRSQASAPTSFGVELGQPTVRAGAGTLAARISPEPFSVPATPPPLSVNPLDLQFPEGQLDRDPTWNQRALSTESKVRSIKEAAVATLAKRRGRTDSSSAGRTYVTTPQPRPGVAAGLAAADSAAVSALVSRPTVDAYNKLAAAPEPDFSTRKIDPNTGEDLLLLSPFDVSAPREAGYTASQTLSGTRLGMTLPDIDSPADPGSVLSYIPAVPPTVNEAPARDDGFLSGGKAKIASNRRVQSAKKDAEGARAQDEQLSQERQATRPASPPPPPEARRETNAAQQPVSTFSLHVSDASFTLAKAALERGETPDPTQIRPEEFYNAFDYGDPAPTSTEKVACRIEQSAHPLRQQRNLVRIAVRVPSTGRAAAQPLHLTVLLDTSGSMQREDRAASLQAALRSLATLLGPQDRVTLIGFARQPRLLAEQLPGDRASELVELARTTPATGGTNLEESLRLAHELAVRHRNPQAQNRIVLLTDGAANLGNADPAVLAATIDALRQQGIAFDACGIGTEGLDDTMIETLTRKGDGRYYVLHAPEDADAGFAKKLAGAFRPAAANVKLQVRFNPARVGQYRLIGFEQHRLNEEDFRNDRVDAAELAAGEAAVALYEVEVLPNGEGELGDVFVRFRDTATTQMVEHSWTMLHELNVAAFDKASPTLQLAGTAALLAEKLQGGDAAQQIDLDRLTAAVNRVRGQYAHNPRVQELVAMFDQVRRRAAR